MMPVTRERVTEPPPSYVVGAQPGDESRPARAFFAAMPLDEDPDDDLAMSAAAFLARLG